MSDTAKTAEMTESGISKALSALARQMLDKGIAKPEARVSFESDQAPHLILGADIKQAPFEGNYYKVFHRGGLADLLASARKYIENLPSPENVIFKTYLGKLADAVDFGHQNGVDAKYVDPVRITQKAMSDNLLAAPKVLP